MNITIVGAGNIGTQFAVHCAEKGHIVTIFGSKPERIGKKLTIVNEKDEVIHCGTIKEATDTPAAAFERADVIFVTMPAYCMDNIARKILPYVRKGLLIGLVPGTGGGECAFRECIEKGAIVFGLQRVPSVARLVEYGSVVRATGYREELHAAAIPNGSTNACAQMIADIFAKKCTPLPNYLNITLTPSNPILHTVRLRVLFKEYSPGIVYQRIPLFYEEWDEESSILLLQCDDEVQELCRALDYFNLNNVKSLRVHYESATAEALTKKISGIAGFRGIMSPMTRVEGGYIPDFDSRYFTADFSYGLAILVQIAGFAGINVPYMEETLGWYRKLIGKSKEFYFSDYGIACLNDLIRFYSK